mgnify:CR=1 FL=1
MARLCIALLFILTFAINSHADIRTGLVGYWRLNESSGTTTADASGYGNTGTLIASPTWTGGKIGNALSLDGSSQYVNVPDNSNISITSGTIAFWVNAASTNNSQVIISKGNYNYMVYFFNRGSGQVINFYASSAGGTWDKYGSTTITTNTWHHVVVTIDASAVNIYVNGSAETMGTNSSGSGNLTTNAVDLLIGRHGSYGGMFNGRLDDVRLYNRVVSAADIAQLYNTGGRRLRNAHFSTLHITE